MERFEAFGEAGRRGLVGISFMWICKLLIVYLRFCALSLPTLNYFFCTLELHFKKCPATMTTSFVATHDCVLGQIH